LEILSVLELRAIGIYVSNECACERVIGGVEIEGKFSAASFVLTDDNNNFKALFKVAHNSANSFNEDGVVNLSNDHDIDNDHRN